MSTFPMSCKKKSSLHCCSKKKERKKKEKYPLLQPPDYACSKTHTTTVK